MTSYAGGADAPGRTVLVLSGVERTYDGVPPVRAVRSASLIISSGDYVSLMGRSGSGKSTLLNLMGLLDRPTAGTVIFTGTDIATLSDSQASALRGRNIGFVFQDFNLLPRRTAAENVALALLYQQVPVPARMPSARHALGRVGLADRADAIPGRLSGGEKQRVAIARAVAGQPSLLLCDEPTGNLDVPTAQAVLALLESLNDDGIALVIVTHDPLVATRARRHLTMTDGVIREITLQPGTGQPETRRNGSS